MIFAIVKTHEKKYFEKLGLRIKKIRESKEMNQSAFAYDCEIGRTQLHMIEKGKTNPRMLTLIKIAKGLEMSIDELLKF